MKIKFYGVRGSYPTPGKDTNEYGGNTTCVTFTNEVDGKIDRVIIDCGTGAIRLGKDIIGNHFAGKEDLNIMMLFTHLHPDHTQAFPFFAPNYFPNAKLNLYGMKALNMHVGKVLDKSMLPPTFPIEYKDLKSERKHNVLKDGDKITSPLGSMKIDVMQAYAPSHPQQGALYFKVTALHNKDCANCKLDNKECNVDPHLDLCGSNTNFDKFKGKSVACIWDNESKTGGDKAVINFAKDCDVMIHDTQYTHEEYESYKMVVQGFGHSTYDMAIENAIQANIRDKLICTHYNPAHSDSKLDQIKSDVTIMLGVSQFERDNIFNIEMAREGLEIDV